MYFEEPPTLPLERVAHYSDDVRTQLNHVKVQRDTLNDELAAKCLDARPRSVNTIISAIKTLTYNGKLCCGFVVDTCKYGVIILVMRLNILFDCNMLKITARVLTTTFNTHSIKHPCSHFYSICLVQRSA